MPTELEERERKDGQVNPPYVDTDIRYFGPFSKIQLKALSIGIIGVFGILYIPALVDLWVLCILELPIGLWLIRTTGWSRTPLENARVMWDKRYRSIRSIWRDQEANLHTVVDISSIEDERNSETTIAGRNISRK